VLKPKSERRTWIQSNQDYMDAFNKDKDADGHKGENDDDDEVKEGTEKKPATAANPPMPPVNIYIDNGDHDPCQCRGGRSHRGAGQDGASRGDHRSQPTYQHVFPTSNPEHPERIPTLKATEYRISPKYPVPERWPTRSPSRGRRRIDGHVVLEQSRERTSIRENATARGRPLPPPATEAAPSANNNTTATGAERGGAVNGTANKAGGRRYRNESLGKNFVEVNVPGAEVEASKENRPMSYSPVGRRRILALPREHADHSSRSGSESRSPSFSSSSSSSQSRSRSSSGERRRGRRAYHLHPPRAVTASEITWPGSPRSSAAVVVGHSHPVHDHHNHNHNHNRHHHHLHNPPPGRPGRARLHVGNVVRRRTLSPVRVVMRRRRSTERSPSRWSRQGSAAVRARSHSPELAFLRRRQHSYF
jgi:hypothetical protein